MKPKILLIVSIIGFSLTFAHAVIAFVIGLGALYSFGGGLMPIEIQMFGITGLCVSAPLAVVFFWMCDKVKTKI